MVNDSGIDPTDRLTNDPTVMVSGLLDGATWSYSVDGGRTWRQGEGDRIPETAFDGDGVQDLLVRQQSGTTGMTSLPSGLSFTLDRTSPTVPPFDARPTTIDRDTGDRAPAFFLFAKGPDESGTLRWQAGDQEGSGTSRSLRLPDIVLRRPGDVVYWHEDAAGNASPKETQYLDGAAPTVLSMMPRGGFVDGSTPERPRMRGGDLLIQGLEPGGRWSYAIDDASWKDEVGDVLSDALLRVPGKHVVRTIHTDSHGNESDLARWQVEVVDSFKLRLKNDTGRTEAQKTDLYTFDATVLVEQANGGFHSAFFSIDGGNSWQPVVGSSIPSDHFSGDGKKQVIVKGFVGDGVPIGEATLDFEVDRTHPGPVRRVAPEGIFVSDTGEPWTTASTGRNLLISTPGLSVLDLEEGTSLLYTTYAAQEQSQQLSMSRWRPDASIPADAFEEGRQLWGLSAVDRAANASDPMFFGTWLDTLRPQAPQVVLTRTAEAWMATDESLEAHGRLEYRRPEGEWRPYEPAGIVDEPRVDALLFRQVDLAGHASDERAPIHIERASPIKLRLKNDTGVTEPQKSDLYTSDATVVVAGIEPWMGHVEYRIDGGDWKRLGDGKEIGATSFAGDGKPRVEARVHDKSGGVFDPVSLSFELDTTPMNTTTLRVVHNKGLVSELGQLDAKGEYTLSNQALVQLVDLEPDATWTYAFYNIQDTKQRGSPLVGNGEFIPKETIDEGAQVIGVHVSDRAGNPDNVIQLINLWLDTTAPRQPEVTVRSEGARYSFIVENPVASERLEWFKDNDWIQMDNARLDTPPLSSVTKFLIRAVDPAGNPSKPFEWDAWPELPERLDEEPLSQPQTWASPPTLPPSLSPLPADAGLPVV